MSFLRSGFGQIAQLCTSKSSIFHHRSRYIIISSDTRSSSGPRRFWVVLMNGCTELPANTLLALTRKRPANLCQVANLEFQSFLAAAEMLLYVQQVLSGAQRSAVSALKNSRADRRVSTTIKYVERNADRFQTLETSVTVSSARSTYNFICPGTAHSLVLFSTLCDQDSWSTRAQ